MVGRPSFEEIDRVTHAFYDAALEPSRWPEALEQLGDLLGGSALGMSIQSRSLGARHLCYSRLDLEQIAIMGERYPTAETNPMVAAMARLPAATATPREAVRPDKMYYSSDLYNDIFRPQEVAHAAVACAHRSNDCFVPLGIFRRSKQGEFSADEFKSLALVLPHLEKALQIHLRMGIAEASSATLDESLNWLPFGILFLDVQGHVWNLNRLAEQVIRNRDGLSLRHAKLHADLTAEDRALQAHIHSALDIVSGTGIGSGGTMTVSRPSMAQSLTVLVCPLPAGRDFPGTRPGAVVFVSDPDLRISPSAAALVDLFGLTPTQSRLTALLAIGLSVDAAAGRLGIKASTARIHLKRVFEKTGAARQADLVRLVLTSVASLATGQDEAKTLIVGNSPR